MRPQEDEYNIIFFQKHNKLKTLLCINEQKYNFYMLSMN